MKIHTTQPCFSLNTSMKYKIRKLDGRYSYREYFKYCLVFPNIQLSYRYVEHFNNALQWFAQTYGPSTEIRMWKDILDHRNRFGAVLLNEEPLPKYVNFNWSWSNGYDDLRIYIKSEKELSFFKMSRS